MRDISRRSGLLADKTRSFMGSVVDRTRRNQSALEAIGWGIAGISESNAQRAVVLEQSFAKFQTL